MFTFYFPIKKWNTLKIKSLERSKNSTEKVGTLQAFKKKISLNNTDLRVLYLASNRFTYDGVKVL